MGFHSLTVINVPKVLEACQGQIRRYRLCSSSFWWEGSFEILDTSPAWPTCLNGGPAFLAPPKEMPPIRAAARRLSATPAQVLFAWLIRSGHQPLTGTKPLGSSAEGGSLGLWLISIPLCIFFGGYCRPLPLINKTHGLLKIFYISRPGVTFQSTGVAARWRDAPWGVFGALQDVNKDGCYNSRGQNRTPQATVNVHWFAIW